MTGDEPKFNVDELDGCRLIEIVWPPRGTISGLAEFILQYYDIWEEDVERPTVLLSDLRRIGEFNENEHQIVRTILGRVRMHPGFIAGAFFYGENTEVRDAFLQILSAAGRAPDSIFSDREDAVDYLRAAIASRE